MDRRLELQNVLETILGSSNVYFQPPESLKLKYPCIVYSLNSIKTDFADDRPYSHNRQYQITIITKDPDNNILNDILQTPMCSFERRYLANNLYHDVCNINY